ncbi:hypothetical protein SAMN04487910_3350 [Aquimarina amphilecti]|uniref:DUF7151 domain-containing protein n=1 Tax=Aquimarina amphilecti TaxID=1038014 RepID=A0A1H7TAF4_AQUAM|nr:MULTISPECIES: hypothetical protein [Aquimarina]AXT56119.1 hypothetical protein D1815_10280 [Aquimarina sp. AD1]MBQ4803787.1 hypothetical protein [Aquimarina sp. MMG015]RKN21973.1 hypothetical protein D7035_12330 [Aquimarina sp. AD1]SEL81840.1 hypothetical protein SAMN04487910_3350 [Aquimarina amphilecti]
MKNIIKLSFLFISVLILSGCEPEDGENGVSGLNSLTVFSKEDSGSNCQYGGIKIELGLDVNSNFVLETNEIETTKFVCGGIDDPISKETRIILHNNNGGASGTSGNYINTYPAIIKFDKRNWSKLRSVVYTASIKSDNSNNSAIVELYDATNFRTISNSVLATRNTEYENVISNNLVESLPEEEINIYLRLRSENNTGDNVWISNKSELIIKQEN